MSDHEPMIHCPPTNEPHTGNYVIFEKLQVGQSTLDGLAALIHWIDGFQDAGKGRVPGGFELVMFYRSFLQRHDGLYPIEKNLAVQARVGRAVMAGWKFGGFLSPGIMTKKGKAMLEVATPDEKELKNVEMDWPGKTDNFDWVEALLNVAGVPK